MDSAVGCGVVGPSFEPHPCLLFCFVVLLFFSIKKALLSSPGSTILSVRVLGTTILSVRTPGTTILS